MCYTKEASITAFLVGSISSLLLLFYGDKKYENQNLVIGCFFLFVSFIQLFDYFMYIDSNCISGWNKIAGYLGPIFNSLQPTILFIFVLMLVKDRMVLWPIIILNIIYLIYIFYLYLQYIKRNNLCSEQKNGRLSWTWYRNGFDSRWAIIYLLLMSINILALIQYKYIRIFALLGIVFFIISYINYGYHIGEFWCWFVNSIPLIILLIQKVIH